MKRRLAWLLIVALLLLVLPATTFAAEAGEMLIASTTVEGEVGEIVKVDFYCYPNLPEGQKLDSLSGSLKYDPEFLTVGVIGQSDEENNLVSFMKGKASNFQYNVTEPGMIRFAFIDAYGVEGEGFWFQAECRIEKEGATEFIFNGIAYTGLETVKDDSGKTSYKTKSYTIEPVSVGGVYTAGETVPTDGAADETFAPLTPAVETPAVSTPTPKPSNPGQTVPQTTTLPAPSSLPSASSGLVTPKPPVTSIPMNTPSGQQTSPAASGNATDAPSTVEPGATEEATTDPNATAQADETAEATDAPVIVAETTPETSDNPIDSQEPTPIPDHIDPEPTQQNRALAIAVIAGIVVVILLAALAIILIILRNRRMNAED